MPVETWFPTIVFFEEVAIEAAAKEQALAAVRERAEPEMTNGGIVITASNTANDLHLDSRLTPLFEQLSPVISRFLYEVMLFDSKKIEFYVGRCWPVVQFDDAVEGGAHVHAGAVFSGVFFLQAPEGSGALVLDKPFQTPADSLEKTKFCDLTYRSATYQAADNRLILFSSDLRHRRLANELAAERIAIAFDLYSMADLDARTSGMPRYENLKRIA